jgi:hypothetical protein
MRNLSVSIAASFFLLACDSGVSINNNAAESGNANSNGTTSIIRPKINKNSPDSALKSYWAIKDWTRRVEDEQFRKAVNTKDLISTREAFSSLVSPEIAERKNYPVDEFHRDIVEAKIETETRASINAVVKNSTPIPEGAEVSEYDRKRREEGDRFRYVMEKTNDGWVVSEIWAFDRLFDKKWTKISPESKKPNVNTLTINGS